MTLEIMKVKLSIVGNRTSEAGDRGFMGRGLKDCTELGKIIVHSIVDEKYYGCVLTTDGKFIADLESGKKAITQLRNSIGIKRGNGTEITIEVKSNFSIPRVDTIARDLKWHYALRDILSEKTPTKVSLQDLNKNNSPDKVIYCKPEGELLVNQKYIVPGYPQAEFHLEICKSPVVLEDPPNLKFRRSGILIIGERAIHECSLFYSGFEKDDVAKKYFGRLECPYIDILLNEWDEREDKNLSHPPDNPTFLIDPNRQDGLNDKHPFTIALFKIPSDILKELIEKDKKEINTEKQEVANQETQKRLTELAKAASKFLSEQIDDVEDNNTKNNLDENIFTKKGALIYPPYLNVALGEVRVLTFYFNKKFLNHEPNPKVRIWTDDKYALFVLDRECTLKNHPKDQDKLICSFRVEGRKIKNNIRIQASCLNKTAEALAKVIQTKIDEHSFIESLEFEHKQYNIKEGSRRTIKLFAKYPEVINRETAINIFSSDSESLPVRGNCILRPIVGSNYAVCEISIQARRITDKIITVAAKLDNLETHAKIKINQNEESKGNFDFNINLSGDEGVGDFRYEWIMDNGERKLKIFAKHESIKRYLGPEPNFDGQKTAHFRLLLAEIATEAISRNILERETQNQSWHFMWANQTEDRYILASVVAALQKRMRKFAPIAHKIMLKDSEIPDINTSQDKII